MTHNPFDPLLHLHMDSPESSFAQNHAASTVSLTEIAAKAAQSPHPLTGGKLRFSFTQADSANAEIAASIVQQAIENIFISEHMKIAVSVLRDAKKARNPHDKEDDGLRHRVAEHRIQTSKSEVTRYAGEALHLLDSDASPDSRSWKRVLTQRNDALHYSRKDTAPYLAAYPDLLPTEIERLVSQCSKAAKSTISASYDTEKQTLEVASTGLGSNVFSQKVSDEIAALQQRLTTPAYQHQHIAQISLNPSEAQLFKDIAAHLKIYLHQEQAKIVAPDPAPLELLTLTTADLQQFTSALSLPKTQSR